MTIIAWKVEDIFGDIKRKDHFVFSLNADGVHPDTGVGYSLVNQVIEEYVHDFKSVGENDIGKVISHECPEYHCWFHGVVTHSIHAGWQMDEDFNTYLAMQHALDYIEDKFGPDSGHDGAMIRPAKSTALGRGKQRNIGATKGNSLYAIQAMANTNLDLVVYTLDGYSEE